MLQGLCTVIKAQKYPIKFIYEGLKVGVSTVATCVISLS